MTRLGAKVTGIDPSATNIGVATTHAAQSGLAIDYRAVPAETLVEEGASFDVVLCMEVVEHVADVPGFLATVGALVKPGGLLLVATINRTPKAFALAIVGAEHVLNTTSWCAPKRSSGRWRARASASSKRPALPTIPCRTCGRRRAISTSTTRCCWREANNE
jgi:ubiquinone biosynthesis O-methyltransferase